MTRLDPQVAAKARKKSTWKRHGKSMYARPTSFSPVPRYCECGDRCWRSGDGTCITCGKTLRNPRAHESIIPTGLLS